MKRASYLNFCCLVITTMTLVSLPASVTRALKSRAVATCAPLWSLMRPWQTAGSSRYKLPPSSLESREKITRLEKENFLLREQCAALQQVLASEEFTTRQTTSLQQILGRDTADPLWKNFFKRRAQHLALRTQMHLQSLPAKVIFRDMRHWGSSMWIDVGEEDNQKLGVKIVAHNSPVVIGNALVGIVENVERHRSEVRLITDARLVPSIRAVRGEQSQRFLLLLLEQLMTILHKRAGLYSSQQEEKTVLSALNDLRHSLQQGWGDYYLAKGELYGSSLPLWRAKRSILHGVGFNYDIADEEGGARDLRTGGGIPLLQPGDLLITSGMDGLFPQGLEVGIVGKVCLLREGDCSYDLEALPAIADFSEIDRVIVLPPCTVPSI